MAGTRIEDGASDAFDAIVVGAGPAGTHTALRLVRAGRRVVVLDKSRFPRVKPCGEFLAPECLPLLDELGLLDGARRAGHAIASMRLSGYERDAVADFSRLTEFGSGPAHGLAVRRERLDAAAVDAVRAAGGEVREGWSVAGLVRRGERVCGVRTRRPDGEEVVLRARFVVGADGLRGRTVRELGGIERTRWLDRMAVWTRVPDRGLGDGARVHFAPGSFCAVAPVGDGEATLNVVVDRDRIPSRRGLRDLVSARLDASDGLRDRVGLPGPSADLFTIGPLAVRARRITAPGVALVGDACGYVDPMTGEGLYYAMRGAQLATEALVPALEGRVDEAAALRGYERSRREFAHRRTMALLLQRALPRPRVASGMLALLERRPGLASLAAGMTGRAIEPRELLRPALWREVLSAR